METRTFCRLCEVGCGLLARTDADGRLVEIRPDHAHPATHGFACNKGLLATEIHRDPARVRRPQRRSDGAFVDVGWDDALAEIADRLGDVIARHGPHAVGVYLGNPNAFNCMAGAGAILFARTLGTDRTFSSASQDCANKYAVAELLYGVAQAHPIPDLDRTELLLVIGSNPRVSKTSFLSVADPVRKLREVRDRGGRVVFVNPLAIEPTIGETLQLRPDTDPYLLAAMLHEIARTRGFRFGPLDGAVEGAGEVEEFVAPYSPEIVAPVVGIPADVIAALARDFADADGASLHVSTGLNMGRQGSLAYWLAQMLLVCTGNLDRPGGSYLASRALPLAPAAVDGSAAAVVSTKWGEYRPTVGMAPAALLADMIEDREEPLRALVVIAGNPALSIGGGDRLSRALRSLDLLVTLDLYRNATGELADFVLPATAQFEREDLNVFVQGIQARPFVQWTGKVTEPDGEAREEWRVLADLLAVMGHTPMLDPTWDDPLPLVFDGPLASRGLSVAALRDGDGVALLDEPGPGASLAQLPERTIRCVPDGLRDTLRRGHARFAELVAEPPDRVKLITRRTPHMLNSAFQNVASLKDRGADRNPLWMHPDDAARLGLVEGAAAEVRNAAGVLVADVAFDARLRPGVVAMTHGFGNQATTGMPHAQAHPGVNVNVLGPSGPGSFEPVSGMAHLTGIPVDVAPAADAPPAR